MRAGNPVRRPRRLGILKLPSRKSALQGDKGKDLEEEKLIREDDDQVDGIERFLTSLSFNF